MVRKPMPRVLVVDDEPDYCEELESCLTGEGCDVRTATTGRQAIQLGAMYRPDVLVADWMLGNDIHGLQVAEVLRTVSPNLQTVLITGFASDDLRLAADQWQTHFIEKPFERNHIQNAVRHATQAEPSSQEQLAIGVVEVDADGAILYANSCAKDLFAETSAGPDAKHLCDLLPAEACQKYDTATEFWVKVSPVSSAPQTWHLRWKQYPDGNLRLLIVLSDEQRHLKIHTVVRLLLEIPLQAHDRWPFEGQALVIERDPLLRRAIVSMLERVGCIAHAASDAESALRLFRRDENILAVLIDEDLPDTDIGSLAEELRAIRPDVIIVGQSKINRQDVFREMRVDRFLHKPWGIDDLINVLTDRIGNCVDCSLPIPLKRPRPGDEASSWECCGCGSRYFAVMDPDSPADIQRNVRRVNPPGAS